MIIPPDEVDALDCDHTTEGEHFCVHDWRIYWGNLPRSGGGE